MELSAPSKIKALRPGYSIVGILLILGVVARIYGAWGYQYSPNSDFTIVALMAKHMAEWRDFHVFFYGQSYLGSFEPIISALFCFLFGCSGFIVSIGTAFIGFLLLPVVYAWGKSVGGRKAGIAALAYSIIGPAGYFHYQASPRGGYAITLFLGTIIIYLVCRIIVGELDGKKLKGRWFLLLGLLAGIGWWSNQLITAALITALLLFIIFLRTRIINLPLIHGLLGFIVASSPFWVWNYYNNWLTFDFLRSFGRTDFWVGLKLFFVDRHLDLLGLSEDAPLVQMVPVIQIIGIIFYLEAVFIALFLLIKGFCNLRIDKSYIYLTASFVFILVSALLFSRLHFAQFNTPRYLLPLVPVIAVIVGVTTAELSKHLRFGLAWLPLIVLIALQSEVLYRVYIHKKDSTEIWRGSTNLPDFLVQHKIEALYGDYEYHWLNFASKERFVYSDLVAERYDPYAEFAESTDNIAILNDYGDVSTFLSRAGGSGEKKKINDIFSLYYNFKPPEGGIQEISPHTWKEAVDSKGNNILKQITDLNLDTFWISTTLGEESKELFQITFKKPVTVSAIRWFSRYRNPEAFRIDGRDDRDSKDNQWKELASGGGQSFFYWSGPRPYYDSGGTHYRMELRFTPQTVTDLRILRPEKSSPRWNNVEITELQIFEPSSASPPETRSLPELLKILKERGVKYLYSDRWEAFAIYKGMGGEVHTERNRLRSINYSVLLHNLPTPVKLLHKTALLVRNENVRLCRDSLLERGIVMNETLVGPWVLFDFTPFELVGDMKNSGLYWAGFGCLWGSDVYSYINGQIGDKTLLELPMNPDDRHLLSSLNDFYEALYQVERINKYSDSVSKEYREGIFEPLSPLNTGEMDEKIYILLNRLKVKYITVHTNRDIFKPEIAPYPPLFIIRKLMRSPYLDFIMNDGGIYLFAVRERNKIPTERERRVSNPLVISNVYDPERLKRGTGSIILDKEVHHHVAWGDVKKNPMGHLTYGPYVNYPKGRYLAYFRLKTSDNSIKEPVVRIEVSSPFHEKEKIFSEMDIRGVDFREGNKYSDFYLYFDLPQWERLEFRTFFYKKADIWVDSVVVSSFH